MPLRNLLPASFLSGLRCLLIATVTIVLTSHLAFAQGACNPKTYKFITLRAPFPGTEQTLAFGINDLGVVVGEYDTLTGEHAFLLQDGKYTSFDVPLPGAVDTAATGINILGQVVGNYTAKGITHGFLKNGGTFLTLDYPAPNVVYTFPRAVNALGQIVGFYYVGTQSHAFLYQAGQYFNIDVPFAASCCSVALGINDRGEIVGAYTDNTNSRILGFARSATGTFVSVALPFPGGALETQAYGISNGQNIVGGGFLYEADTFIPLGNLNPQAANAVGIGINDLGEITGILNGIPGDPSGEAGFLMIPQ